MRAVTLYDDGHKWIFFGRDPAKPESIIDTNQYLVASSTEAILLDPGGIELFAPMLASVLKYVGIEQLTQLFASHQDPDIISSLGLWDQVLPKAKLWAPWIWEGFLRHFGMERIEYAPLKDGGGIIRVGDVELQAIPAHYLHSSGNFHIYDPRAKILFSGDIGAALEPITADIYVDDFELHTSKMKLFHQRWMPSNEAKLDWVNRVRKLDIDMMLPQHGRIFKGDDVQHFLNWFERLPVGIAIGAG